MYMTIYIEGIQIRVFDFIKIISMQGSVGMNNDDAVFGGFGTSRSFKPVTRSGIHRCKLKGCGELLGKHNLNDFCWCHIAKGMEQKERQKSTRK